MEIENGTVTELICQEETIKVCKFRPKSLREDEDCEACGS